MSTPNLRCQKAERGADAMEAYKDQAESPLSNNRHSKICHKMCGDMYLSEIPSVGHYKSTGWSNRGLMDTGLANSIPIFTKC